LRIGLQSSIGVVVCWLGWPGAAGACDCMPPLPPAKALARAAAVFEADVSLEQAQPKVEGVTREASGATKIRSITPGATRVRLRVLRAWKGAQPGEVVTITREAGTISDCDYPFQHGTRLLVYATRSTDGSLSVSAPHCDRTRPSASAGTEIAELDRLAPRAPASAPGPLASPPTKPQARPATAPPPPASDRGGACTAAGGAESTGTLLLAALVACAWMLRRR
jgi:hypothetical protein